MNLQEIKTALLEIFEWLGDANLGERSHRLIPIDVQREYEPAQHHTNTQPPT